MSTRFQHPDDHWMDYYATIYRVNQKTLKEIQINAWLHPTVIPEDMVREMDFAWDQMLQMVPESFMLEILRCVYGE